MLSILEDLMGKKVDFIMDYSVWGESTQKGEIIEVNSNWTKLKQGRSILFLPLKEIKGIRYKTPKSL